jgi:hypothetical protein
MWGSTHSRQSGMTYLPAKSGHISASVCPPLGARRGSGSSGGAWQLQRRQQRQRRAPRPTRCSVSLEEPPPAAPPEIGKNEEVDVVVIGSGIGGELQQQPFCDSSPGAPTYCSTHVSALAPPLYPPPPRPPRPGLCAAALLARYGFRVAVCESHYHAGGAAHGFEVQGYHFDAGPSFFAGLSGEHPRRKRMLLAEGRVRHIICAL